VLLVKRDAQATRARILAAATSEFAAYGIAGARVDRIAAGAQANKNMIYIYFGSKEQLFGAVFSAAIDQLLETVPIDVHDLPGYAGSLFDHAEQYPELSRLARWQGLERPLGLSLEAALSGTMNKVKAIAAAQQAGTLARTLTPDQLLAILLSIAMAWSAGGPELLDMDVTEEVVAARRAAVVWAVERLTTP
jgi:AcrR family transcriptional regulator